MPARGPLSPSPAIVATRPTRSECREAHAQECEERKHDGHLNESWPNSPGSQHPHRNQPAERSAFRREAATCDTRRKVSSRCIAVRREAASEGGSCARLKSSCGQGGERCLQPHPAAPPAASACLTDAHGARYCALGSPPGWAHRLRPPVNLRSRPISDINCDWYGSLEAGMRSRGRWTLSFCLTLR